MIDDAAHETEIIEYLLDPAASDETFRIPDDDMIEFLSAVSKQEVEMDPEAEDMLKDYFAATRTIRESEWKFGEKNSKNKENSFADSLTPKAFAILQQMAESHAKLCFRQKVTRNDVLGVINISETFIRALFDKDSYSSPPEPNFAAIEDVDDYRKQLETWNTNFTKNILRRQI